ncbi:hypothetical protein Q3G72_030077 [Acer saccharum]|nr:hypothetical protein Q3G72_030077 [Acer saccharum]
MHDIVVAVQKSGFAKALDRDNCSLVWSMILRLRIEDPPRRKHMVYLGGAILARIMKLGGESQPPIPLKMID